MVSGSLCIIGKDKSEDNLKLLEESKNFFEKVFFATIDGIGIGFKDEFSITYKSLDLTKFDAILPRIPREYYSYAYQIFSLFPPEVYTPIKPIGYLISDERFFLLTVLRKRKIPTINLELSSSSAAAVKILKDQKFPTIIRVPDKTTGVIAESFSEAKSVVETLGSLKQPVLIEDPVKDMVSVYVSGDEILCSLKKNTKEKDVVFGKGDWKKTSVNRDVEILALDTISALDSRLGRIDITLNGSPKVVNVDLNPNLTLPSKLSGKDLPHMVVNFIFEDFKRHREKPMLVKFFDDAKSVVKDVLKSKTLI